MTMDQQLIQGITEKLKQVEQDMEIIATDIQTTADQSRLLQGTLNELSHLRGTLTDLQKDLEALVTA